MENGNGTNGNGIDASRLAGLEKRDKTADRRVFPIKSLDDVLASIRRAGGTGKLEINFKDGQARGDAKWKGFSREGA